MLHVASKFKIKVIRKSESHFVSLCESLTVLYIYVHFFIGKQKSLTVTHWSFTACTV